VGMTEPTESPSSASIPSTDAELESLLKELSSKGQSIASFCRDHGIPTGRIYQAKQRAARRKQRKLVGAGIELVRAQIATDPQASPVEILLAGGHRLALRADFDEVALRRLLGVLASC